MQKITEPHKEDKELPQGSSFNEVLFGTNDIEQIRNICLQRRKEVRAQYKLPPYSLYERPAEYVKDLVGLAETKGYRVEKDLGPEHPAYIPNAQGYIDHNKKCISIPPKSFENPETLFAQIKNLEHEVIHALNGTRMEPPYRTKDNTTPEDIAKYEFEASIGSQITVPIINGDKEVFMWFISFVRQSVDVKCKELGIPIPWAK